MTDRLVRAVVVAPPRVLTGLVLAVALVLVALVGFVPPASAHSALTGSTPGDGEQLEVPPTELVLEFSEDIQDIGTEIVVTDAAGADATGGDPVVDANVVTVPLSGTQAGSYDVVWRVVSADGHPIAGELAFTAAEVAEPATTAGDDPASASTASDEPTPSSAGATSEEASTTESATSSAPGSTDADGTDDAIGAALVAIGLVVVVGLLLTAGLVLRRQRLGRGRP